MIYVRANKALSLAFVLACTISTISSSAAPDMSRKSGPGNLQQGPGGPGVQEAGQEGPGGRGARMAQELGLNEQQKAKFEQASKEFRKKMKSLHDDFEKQIQGILTPEQYAKFKQRRRPGMEGGPEGGPEGGEGAGMGMRMRRFHGAGGQGPASGAPGQ